MMRKFIVSAMRSSIEEILGNRLDEMNGSLKRIESRVDAMDQRLGARIDDCIKQTVALGARLDSRIDEMGVRLGSRIDELSGRQGHLIEEVVNLKGEVAARRIDHKLVDTLEHRVARIEDRLFVKAG